MALQAYEGAMVLVSHDRHLLRSVTDQFLLVDEGKIKPFNDDLDAYRNWLLQPRSVENIKTNDSDNVDINNKTINKKELRQQQADIRKQLQPLKNEVSRLEKDMQQTQQKVEGIEQELALPEMYEAENRQRLDDLSRERSKLADHLEQVEESWLEKSEELDQLS